MTKKKKSVPLTPRPAPVPTPEEFVFEAGPAPDLKRFAGAAVVALVPQFLYAYYGMGVLIFAFFMMVRQTCRLTRWAWLMPLVLYGLLFAAGVNYDTNSLFNISCRAILLILRPFYSGRLPVNWWIPQPVDTWVVEPIVRYTVQPMTMWMHQDIYRTLEAGWIYAIAVTALCGWASQPPRPASVQDRSS